jgi:hypothetical protein
MARTLADDIADMLKAQQAVDQAQQAVGAAKDAVNAHIPPDRPFVLPDGRVVVKLASGLFIGAPLDPSTVPIP